MESVFFPMGNKCEGLSFKESTHGRISTMLADMVAKMSKKYVAGIAYDILRSLRVVLASSHFLPVCPFVLETPQRRRREQVWDVSPDGETRKSFLVGSRHCSYCLSGCLSEAQR